MDQAQGAAGTGESEQPTQTQQEPKAEALSPLQAAVRKELGVEGQRPEKSQPSGTRASQLQSRRSNPSQSNRKSRSKQATRLPLQKSRKRSSMCPRIGR